jgi:alpha 1,3-glucosidase
MRYELFHYWYTAFYQSHTLGVTVMRPLWYNFPKDKGTLNITDSFMIGDSLMIVPKLKSATYDLYDSIKSQGKHYNLSFYLPEEGAPWYKYASDEVQTGSWQMASIRDMLIFVRAGSIIPVKLHNRKLSLTRAQTMPMRLDIYLDLSQTAQGQFFFDDGVSFKYRDSQESLSLSLTFSNQTLTSSPSLPYSFVEDAYYMFITSIHLYGLTYCPSHVLVEWTEIRPVVC